MDPIWKNLPLDLAEKICNMLPQIRRVSPMLKNELVSYVNHKEFYYTLTQYESVWGRTFRAFEAFTDDMYNVLNNWELEPSSQWLVDNAFDGFALFGALTDEQRQQILLEI